MTRISHQASCLSHNYQRPRPVAVRAGPRQPPAAIMPFAVAHGSGRSIGLRYPLQEYHWNAATRFLLILDEHRHQRGAAVRPRSLPLSRGTPQEQSSRAEEDGLLQ